MAYKILTHNGIDNTNIDGARDYNFNTNGKSGVLKGFLQECRLILEGSTIIVQRGELRLAGHRVVITEEERLSIYSTPSKTTPYIVVAKIIVTDSQPEFSVELRTYPTTLRQDNLYSNESGNGTYEIELGRYSIDENGSIINLINTAEFLEKVDNALSSTSTNPVQNKVVTEEFIINRNFEHPKVKVGNDYPNFIGKAGTAEGWQLVFYKNTTWVWLDTNIYNSEELTLDIPSDLETSTLLIFAKVVVGSNIVTKNDFEFVEYSKLNSVNLKEYRYIAFITIPKNETYSPIPWIDLGGVPYRWKGEIVENIELKESLATINGQSIINGGKNIEISGGNGSIEVDSALSLDSENPVQNKIVTEALDNKVDKLTPTDAAQYYPEIYAMTKSKNPYLLGTTIVGTDSTAGGGYVPVYLTQDGITHLLTGTPTRAFHCANKKYVDDNATKQYKHTITVNYTNFSFDIQFYSVKKNTDSVEYYNNEHLDINADGIITEPYIVFVDNNVETGTFTISTSSLDHAIYQFNFSSLGFGEITIESVVETYVGV